MSVARARQPNVPRTRPRTTPRPSARVRRNLARPNVAIIPIRQDSAVGPNAVRTFADQSVADVRRYWDARPCNIRHSPKPVGLEGVLRRGRGAEVLRRAAHSRRSPSSSAGAGKRVLEVGCGIGTDSINFARAGAELTAVDLSGESLRIAEQRADVMGVADRIRFVRGERRGARVGARRRAVRPRLLVRRRSTTRRTRTERSRRCARLAAPGGDAQADGLPPALVEGLLDPGRRRSTAGSGTTDELIAKHSEAQTGCPVPSPTRGGRARALVERRRLPRAGAARRSRLPVPDPRLRGVPVREGAVLPLDAGAVFRRIRARVRLAPPRHGGGCVGR